MSRTERIDFFRSLGRETARTMLLTKPRSEYPDGRYPSEEGSKGKSGGGKMKFAPPGDIVDPKTGYTPNEMKARGTKPADDDHVLAGMEDDFKTSAKPGQVHGVKKTDLPSGAKVSHDGSISWYKRGGYADKQFDRVEEKLKKAGFKAVDSRSTGNPDGSVMGNNSLFRHKSGATATFTKSYGNVKSDNSFTITIKPAAGTKVDLSVDELDELVGVESDESVDRQTELRTKIQLAMAVESLRGETR